MDGSAYPGGWRAIAGGDTCGCGSLPASAGLAGHGRSTARTRVPGLASQGTRQARTHQPVAVTGGQIRPSWLASRGRVTGRRP